MFNQRGNIEFYLAVAIAWGLSVAGTGWYCYNWGDESATNKAGAEHAKALEQTIQQARQQAIEDMQMDQEFENQREKVRVEFRDRVVTVEKLVRENPTNCPLPAGYRLRVNESIDAINSPKPAPVGKVQTAAETKH